MLFAYLILVTDGCRGDERADDTDARFLEALTDAEKHCLQGLGGSQKGEVAYLDKMGLPYEELCITTIGQEHIESPIVRVRELANQHHKNKLKKAKDAVTKVSAIQSITAGNHHMQPDLPQVVNAPVMQLSAAEWREKTEKLMETAKMRQRKMRRLNSMAGIRDQTAFRVAMPHRRNLAGRNNEAKAAAPPPLMRFANT